MDYDKKRKSVLKEKRCCSFCHKQLKTTDNIVIRHSGVYCCSDHAYVTHLWDNVFPDDGYDYE